MRKMVMMNMNEKTSLRARITAGDVSVELEAKSPEELEEVVKRVLSAIGERTQRPAQAKRGEGKRASTCRDILERLLDEGWFTQSRSLGDVTAELARRGYFYDPTAVAHGLLDLVREERLVREGAPRRYRYRATSQPKEEAGEGGYRYLFRVKCPYCGSEQGSESLVAVTCRACGASFDAAPGGAETHVIDVVREPQGGGEGEGGRSPHHDSH